MKKYLYAAMCLFFSFFGLVAGGIIEFNIGESNLPPDAWAGDNFGVMLDTVFGAFWGAVIGLGIGGICCLLWYVFVQRQTMPTTAEAILAEGEVWPPAPKNN